MDAEDAPAFRDISDHDDLLDWSRAYARRARREHGFDVRLDLVEWEVSTRARRRAAAVKRPRLRDVSVGDPLDWETVPDADGRPLPCTVSLTWKAFEAFERSEWQSTLRHELIHVEQYQRCGTTDHGAAFRRRAEAVDAEVHCRVFSEPKWRFHCEDCGELVARRYRDCEFVRRYDEYLSNCCGAALSKTATGD